MASQKHGKIVRGFSMVDPELVSKLHTDIKTKGKDDEEMDNSYGYNFREIAHFNFTLPDFSQFDQELVDFIMKDLIENSTLKALEESGHLNWWVKGSSLQRLYPLLTLGDGNCLLHAASLGIWGIHDRLLNLRQAVYHTLSSNLAETTLKRRWLFYTWVKNLQEGLVFSAEEWENEWKSVLNMADVKPRSPQQLSTVPEGNTIENEESMTKEDSTENIGNSWQPSYESLEEIHICSLAHALRRPVIVVSDNWVYDFHGNAMSPIPFAGVYLPVEYEPAECCRIPLVLAYSSSHFSPVVSTELLPQITEDNATSLITSDDDKPETSSGSDPDCPTTHSASKTSDVATTTPSTIIQAMSSFIKVTKSTLFEAAKSLSPSSMLTTIPTSPTNKTIFAAIPLVDKDLKTLPLPFAAIPDTNWDWLNQENCEDIVKEKTLSEDKRMSLLKKYLDVAEIDITDNGGQRQEVSGEADGETGKNQADVKEQSDQVELNQTYKIPVAVLPCDNQPSFYKEVIKGYLEKAKQRFDFDKETKVIKPEPTESLKCANDGCDLYGTVANNYLCTKCFQLQTKSIHSIVKYQEHHQPPPYNPPSYSDAVGNDQVFYSPSFTGQSSDSSSTKEMTTLKEMSTQCRADGCTFYGTSDKNGFCSKCYEKNKK
ncbi:uncharacterized protein LOC114533938 [Dendronephthya gigantea]|uniref:uncharacterized protein LOC114533938 n=1 Tax=Dendronephthya gigantea TaxID=151771 RepID=UPI00106D18A4|nr:uncharacterized protein LOC114533938 [Dendronephthya gigantea]